MKSFKLNLTIFFPILILGAVLRFYSFSTFPPSLNWDEVSQGYNAYSLFLTGHDEWGVTLPIILRAFGDYKLPVYTYATVLSEKLFGLNSVSVRLFSGICGVGLIAVTYLFARRWFPKNPPAALIGSLLVAVSPWTWFLSRIALEANAAALLIALGLYLLYSRRFVLSGLFLGLSTWTYNSARIFVPVFLIFWGLSNIHHRSLKIFRFLLPFIIFFIPVLIQLISPSGQSRYGWLTLLDEGAIARINNLRGASRLPGMLPRLVFNKATYFVLTASENYLSYFSPGFLFLSGGSQYQFSIPGHGLLYLCDLPFFILGLIVIFRSHTLWRKFILLWIFIYPLAGSITRDSPHTLRAIPFLPLPMIITALGVSLAWKLRPPAKLIGFIYLIVLSVNCWIYFARVTTVYSKEYSQSWQYGYAQIIDYIKKHYSDYDRIIITKKYGEPHEFLYFYYPWPPGSILTDPNLNRYYRTMWYWTDSIDKFRFINDWEMADTVKGLDQTKKYLIISGDQNFQLRQLTKIYFLDNSVAFIAWQK